MLPFFWKIINYLYLLITLIFSFFKWWELPQLLITIIITTIIFLTTIVNFINLCFIRIMFTFLCSKFVTYQIVANVTVSFLQKVLGLSPTVSFNPNGFSCSINLYSTNFCEFLLFFDILYFALVCLLIVVWTLF